ncbi:MAG TPA: aldehyde dehydrogenase family protein [Bdellovibrionota bacterium]|nr:aldehyde dehydrogenase family protein [Bdellovibrionota bacterium]
MAVPSDALISTDPYTGKVLGSTPWSSSLEVERALTAAHAAAEGSARAAPAHERAALLREAERKLRERRAAFVDLMVREVGKPVTYAEVEVDRALGVLSRAAGEAERWGGEWLPLDAAPSGRQGLGWILREPRGTVLGITPFNFPLNLLLHKLAPALACGCPILIKPSPRAPLTARATVELFDHAPHGWVGLVMTGDESTLRLAADPRVATVSFTGSSDVGWKLRSQLGGKPVVLELGGNAWALVGDDLDPAALAQAARKIARGAFGYAGQSCISVQNVAVQSGIWPRFRELFHAEVRDLAFGDPSDRRTVSGPVITAEAARRIRSTLATAAEKSRVESALRVGAPSEGAPDTVLTPTALEYVEESPLSSIHLQEVFAPLVTLRPFSRWETAVEWVNRGAFGLQAGVFSQRWPTIHRLARDLRVGGVVVGDAPTVRFDHQPYGGVKQSGLGREGIRWAMEEFTEAKFVALGE